MGSLFLMPLTKRHDSQNYSTPLLDFYSRRRAPIPGTRPRSQSSIDRAWIVHAAGRKEATRKVETEVKFNDEGSVCSGDGNAETRGPEVASGVQSGLLHSPISASVSNGLEARNIDENLSQFPSVSHVAPKRLVKKRSSTLPSHGFHPVIPLPRIECSASFGPTAKSFIPKLGAPSLDKLHTTTPLVPAPSHHNTPTAKSTYIPHYLPPTSEELLIPFEYEALLYPPNRTTFGLTCDDTSTIRSSSSTYDLSEILARLTLEKEQGRTAERRPRSVSVGSTSIGVSGIVHVSDDDFVHVTTASKVRRRTGKGEPPSTGRAGKDGIYPLYHTRPAPLPPHLLPSRSTSLRVPSNTNGQDTSGKDSHISINILDQSTNLGTLWRRLSGSGRSTPKRVGSDSEVSQLGSKEDKEAMLGDKLGRKGSMVRALSWRKIVVREIEVVEPTDSSEGIATDEVDSWQTPIVPPRISSLTPSWTTGSDLSFDLSPQRLPTSSRPSHIPLRASSLPHRPTRISFSVTNPHSRHRSAPPVTTPHSRPDPSHLNHAPGGTDTERKRRFRRTLVNVVDDADFQQLVHDAGNSGMLDYQSSIRSKADVDEELVGLALTTDELITASSVLEDEKVEPERYTVQAWFSTRELVQGERRYSRILARGISIARSVAEQDGPEPNDFSPKSGHPTSPSSLYSPTSTSPVKRFSRSSMSTPPSTTTSQSRLSFPTYSNSFYTLPTPPSPPSPNPHFVEALQIGLKRLPRLLALSLTLSSRFAHDPSPVQIATAFLSMEDALIFEISGWAGEVGKLISMGLGEMVNGEMANMGGTYRSSIFKLANFDFDMTNNDHNSDFASVVVGSTEKADRTSFGEILLAPIQRAARYRLLFKSLLGKMPLGYGRERVQEALWASERVLKGVDKGQGFDMEGLRRNGVDGKEDVAVVMRRKSGLKGRRVRSMYT